MIFEFLDFVIFISKFEHCDPTAIPFWNAGDNVRKILLFFCNQSGLRGRSWILFHMNNISSCSYSSISFLSTYKIWTNGRILMFNVCKWLYQCACCDRIIFRLHHNPPIVKSWTKQPWMKFARFCSILRQNLTIPFL